MPNMRQGILPEDQGGDDRVHAEVHGLVPGNAPREEDVAERPEAVPEAIVGAYNKLQDQYLELVRDNNAANFKIQKLEADLRNIRGMVDAWCIIQSMQSPGMAVEVNQLRNGVFADSSGLILR
jgi:hypothetical protein